MADEFVSFYFSTAIELDEKIRFGDTYAVSKRNTKYANEVNYEELEKAVFASTLSNQIVLEIADNIPLKERNELADKLFQKLKKAEIPHSFVFSGGSSFHFHIFIEPTLFKKLSKMFSLNFDRIMVLGERIKFKEVLAKFLLKKIGCDLSFDKLDRSFFQKSHMFPFPNKKRKDKPKPTKLGYHVFDYWTFDPLEFKEFVESQRKVNERDKEFIYISSLRISKPTSAKLALLERSLLKEAEKGAVKGERDNSSFKFYMRLRSLGFDKEKATEMLKTFLLNSEPKGVFDEEKQVILEKVDKYWEEYFKENVYNKTKEYKVPSKVEEKINLDDEVANEVVEEYLSKISGINMFIEEIESPSDTKEFICVVLNDREFKIPYRTREGELNFKKAIINLNKELFFRLGDRYWLDSNDMLKAIEKEKQDSHLFDVIFVGIYNKLPKKKYTLISSFVNRVIPTIERELSNKYPKEKLEEDDIDKIMEVDLTTFIDAFCSEMKMNPIKLLSSLSFYLDRKDGKIVPKRNLANIVYEEIKKREKELIVISDKTNIDEEKVEKDESDDSKDVEDVKPIDNDFELPGKDFDEFYGG